MVVVVDTVYVEIKKNKVDDTSPQMETNGKIIVIYTPNGIHYFDECQIGTQGTSCTLCENDVPFSSESYKVLFEDSFPIEEVTPSIKFHYDDLLDEQERFLKEKEKKNFRKICKGRR